MFRWVKYSYVMGKFTKNIIGYYIAQAGNVGRMTYVNIENIKKLTKLGWIDESVNCCNSIYVEPYAISYLYVSDSHIKEILERDISYDAFIKSITQQPHDVDRDAVATGIITKREEEKEPKVVWTAISHVYYDDSKDYYGAFISSTDRRTRVVSSRTAAKMVDAGILQVPSTIASTVKYVPRNFEEDTTYLFEGFPIRRPSWDESFMSKAVLASKRATCNRLNVGAVLVRGKRAIAEGYNGSRHGQPHCHDVGCLIHNNRCVRTIHAERNVIDMCARYGIPTEGTTLYVTHYPCPDCMQAIANAGITEVVYMHHYKHKFNNDFHEGMNIRQYDGPEIKI